MLPGTGLKGQAEARREGERGQHISSILRKDLVKSELPKDVNEFSVPRGGQVKAG